MGQNISMIITKEIDTKISNKIPHIIENDLLIIGLKNNEFARFIKRVLRAYRTDLEYYIEDFEFITLIKQLNIKTFLAYHESDWGGIPVDSIRFAVVDHEIIIESIESDELEDSEDPFLLLPTDKVNAEELLGIHTNKINYLS